MRILLTSFDISETGSDGLVSNTADLYPAGYSRHLPSPIHWADQRLDGRDMSMYYRMPPIDMRSITKLFLPDYASLLLADKIVMDGESFSLLQSGSHPLYHKVSETLHSLHEEGYVDLVDFRSTLQANRPLLETMLKLDMRILDEWVQPLRMSIETWMGFVSQTAHLMSGPGLDADEQREVGERLHIVVNQATSAHSLLLLSEALESSRKRRKSEYRDVLRRTLQPYLRYINCNLVLAREFSAGFHDWSDFLPFYERKFLTIGQETTEPEEHAGQLRKLFSVPFPELAIRDTKQLLRAIKDKRIQELRNLVSQAVAGAITFDQEFAKRTLLEVLRIEKDSQRWRTITSYLTIPMGLIPGVGTILEKATEEAAGRIIDKHFQKEYQWYYLLSDVAKIGESTQQGAQAATDRPGD